MYQIALVLATGLVTKDNSDRMVKSMRRLQEIMFPEDPVAKAKREKVLKELIQEETKKEYTIRK